MPKHTGIERLVKGEATTQGNHTVIVNPDGTRGFAYHGSIICIVNDKERAVCFPYKGYFANSPSTKAAVAKYRREFSEYTVIE
jgi:hypothetical protein